MTTKGMQGPENTPVCAVSVPKAAPERLRVILPVRWPHPRHASLPEDLLPVFKAPPWRTGSQWGEASVLHDLRDSAADPPVLLAGDEMKHVTRTANRQLREGMVHPSDQASFPVSKDLCGGSGCGASGGLWSPHTDQARTPQVPPSREGLSDAAHGTPAGPAPGCRAEAWLQSVARPSSRPDTSPTSWKTVGLMTDFAVVEARKNPCRRRCSLEISYPGRQA